MSRTLKFYRDGFLFFMFLCTAVLSAWAVTSLVLYKPLTLTGGIGEILSIVLSLLWMGNLFLYRPRSAFQRIVSFLFLFTTYFSRIAVERVSQQRPIDFTETIHVAISTAVIMYVAAWVRRKYDAKVKASAKATATQTVATQATGAQASITQTVIAQASAAQTSVTQATTAATITARRS